MTRRTWMLMLLLAGGAVGGVCLQFANEPLLSVLCQEDGVVEDLQALLLLGTAGIFAYLGTKRGHRTLWNWGYALLFFVAFGEEISWGQRIFGLETPEQLARINVQGETNFHNIDGIHQHHRLIGVLGGLIVCFAIPLADRYSPRLRALLQKLRLPVFPFWAAGILAVSVAVMTGPRLFGTIIFNIDEIGELYMYLAFFVFALTIYRQAAPSWSPAPASTTSTTGPTSS